MNIKSNFGRFKFICDNTGKGSRIFQTPKVGTLTYYFVYFPQKLHAIEKQWTEKAHIPGTPSDPPMNTEADLSERYGVDLVQYFPFLHREKTNPFPLIYVTR